MTLDRELAQSEMRRAGISIKDMAHRAGISRIRLEQILSTEDATGVEVFQIAAVLGVEPSDIERR
jgi:lambda repressor-like predicted transcriptional regulator